MLFCFGSGKFYAFSELDGKTPLNSRLGVRAKTCYWQLLAVLNG